MTGFFCPRCGTLWGWITTAPGRELLRARMQRCVDGACCPTREILNNLAGFLRDHPAWIPDQERVLQAIEDAEERWAEQLRKWNTGT